MRPVVSGALETWKTVRVWTYEADSKPSRQPGNGSHVLEPTENWGHKGLVIHEYGSYGRTREA